jgi:hypothetical protein
MIIRQIFSGRVCDDCVVRCCDVVCGRGTAASQDTAILLGEATADLSAL